MGHGEEAKNIAQFAALAEISEVRIDLVGCLGVSSNAQVTQNRGSGVYKFVSHRLKFCYLADGAQRNQEFPRTAWRHFRHDIY